MCFSSTASFISSAVLITGGTLAIRHYKPSKRECLLAWMPIIFGAHQFIEGLVWLGVGNVIDISIQNAAMYLFTFIAMCFWPFYIPLAMLIYEAPNKQKSLGILLCIGALISTYLFWCFTAYSELHINIQCCNSIAYIYRLPFLYGIIDYFYVAIVVAPFLLSNNPRIRYILGPGFLSTFFVALALESGGDYPSIWCFLAAILSILVVYSLNYKPHAPRRT